MATVISLRSEAANKVVIKQLNCLRKLPGFSRSHKNSEEN
jgi:hypothetical protein